MSRRRAFAKVTSLGNDPRSRAKCNLNHLVACPNHTPAEYVTRALHRKGKHE